MSFEKDLNRAKSLDSQYWKTNYANPADMDGIYNASDHVRYMKALFKLELISIDSVVEFGCGYGHILEQLALRLRPSRLEAVELSREALRIARSRVSRSKVSTKVLFHAESLQAWCERHQESKQVWDLGVCNSVFQYIPTGELRKVIPVLAKKFRYLYLTVPTRREYIMQRKIENFVDPYAFHRPKAFYLKTLGQSFTFVGTRMLESKIHFSEESSHFTELLFRR